jgi:uncharacterized protein (DUF342 family)
VQVEMGMNEEKTITDCSGLIEVSISEDKTQGFIKLEKPPEGCSAAFTKEQFVTALQQNKIIFGVSDSAVEKLALRPIFNIRIKVAQAQAPVNGQDGIVKCLVKKDAEYKPEYSEEETIDYKNVKYFQMVKKGQVLCEIEKEQEGVPGINVLGEAIPASKGKKPLVPQGKNTSLNEDESQLIADCDGIVKFVSTIQINEMMHINKDVDFSTGNIDFSGDVTIDGDVSHGFSVKCGGNLIVKGVVEGSVVEATGNVMVAKGIYGSETGSVKVGGDLRCNYIENAKIELQGDLTVDYIIDSKINCNGNIFLSGNKEVIVGGEIKLAGELIAKDIGNEREYPTIIRILGTEIVDEAEIEKLKSRENAFSLQLDEINGKEKQVNELLLSEEKKAILNRNYDDSMMNQLKMIKKELDRQVLELKQNLKKIQESVEVVRKKAYTTYYGSISIKRKLYRGTRIYFGDLPFCFELDNLEHCKIYWDNDQIVNNVL